MIEPVMGSGVVNIRDLIDDANCYRKVRELRWPEGYGARFAVTSTSSSKASIPPKSSVSDTSASPAADATSTI